MGVHQTEGFAVCWRCGWHSVDELIKTVLRTTDNKAVWEVKREFLQGLVSGPHIHRKKHQRSAKELSLPPETMPMTDRHKNYLSSRGFDPDELEKTWDLKGTHPIGAYAHRIIAPITFRNRLVSYVGRDITGLAHLRYKPCEAVNEIISHQAIVYGWDFVNKKALVVEGPSDTWMMGPGSVATHGIKWTKSQRNMLATLDRVFILYDNEPGAQKQAQKLANELSYLTEAYLVEDVLEEGADPGSMKNDDAKALMRDLGF